MPEQSPIAEAQPAESLAELFQRDPLELTDEQINAIIDALRSSRKKFVLAEAEAKMKGKKIKTSDGISAEDLGL